MILRPVYAIIEREVLKLLRQRARLVSAMVRPMIWLLVIGAGFDALLERSGGAHYMRFLVPGMIGMAILFGAMLAALSTVYDKESGVMRMLVVAPFAHYWIVLAKTASAALVAMIQALLLMALLALLGLLGGQVSVGLFALALAATSLACAALGMVVAAWTRTLENYAVMMNFVIFPVFFLSGSLYPVGRLPEIVRIIASINPYTYGVDLLKHAVLGGQLSAFGPDFTIGADLGVLALFVLLAVLIACWRFSRETAYEPLIHVLSRKQGD